MTGYPEETNMSELEREIDASITRLVRLLAEPRRPGRQMQVKELVRRLAVLWNQYITHRKERA